jgi:hypothetical protein
MLLGLQIRNDDPASALAAWDSDGDVGKGGRRAFVRCTLYALRHQQTPSGSKGPRRKSTRWSRWQQGAHLTALGSKGTHGPRQNRPPQLSEARR